MKVTVELTEQEYATYKTIAYFKSDMTSKSIKKIMSNLIQDKEDKTLFFEDDKVEAMEYELLDYYIKQREKAYLKNNGYECENILNEIYENDLMFSLYNFKYLNIYTHFKQSK